MPDPVSVTQSEMYWPGGRSPLARARVVEPLVGGLDRQPTAVGHRVARVDAQVEQRVLELVRVDQRRPQPAGADDLDARSSGPTVRRSSSSMSAISRLTSVGSRVERLAAREREQAVGQRRRALRRALRRRDVAVELAVPALRSTAPASARGCPMIAGQQIVEVVREAAGELADRLHLLRLAQAAPAPPRVRAALPSRR